MARLRAGSTDLSSEDMPLAALAGAADSAAPAFVAASAVPTTLIAGGAAASPPTRPETKVVDISLSWEEKLKQKADAKDATLQDKYALAECYYARKKYEPAKDLYSAIVKAHSITSLHDPLSLRILIGRCFNRLGEIKQFEEAKNIFGSSKTYLDLYEQAKSRGSILAVANLLVDSIFAVGEHNKLYETAVIFYNSTEHDSEMDYEMGILMERRSKQVSKISWEKVIPYYLKAANANHPEAQYKVAQLMIDHFSQVNRESADIVKNESEEVIIQRLRQAYKTSIDRENDSLQESIIQLLRKAAAKESYEKLSFLAQFTLGWLVKKYEDLSTLANKFPMKFASALAKEDMQVVAEIKRNLKIGDSATISQIQGLLQSYTLELTRMDEASLLPRIARGISITRVSGPGLPTQLAKIIAEYLPVSHNEVFNHIGNKFRETVKADASSSAISQMIGTDVQKLRNLVHVIRSIAQDQKRPALLRKNCNKILQQLPVDMCSLVIDDDKNSLPPKLKM